MALCANLDRVALQAKLPEFDDQGLVDRLGCRNPGTIQIPGVDEAVGERAESGPARTGGAGTVGGGTPTGADESQRWLETLRSKPALEPSAPEPSAPAEPGPSITAAELGPPSAVVEPGPADAAAEPVSAVAEPRPVNVAAETKTQPPPCSEPTTAAAPERPAPAESAPSVPSTGRMTAG
ncbi:predicted GPI-anchored protein 58 [Phragmites australis]|uniref:predicted GPI-anchored protein 58 n=1 Tax=Phragmites australis TaxID=29695 RepID=UPI002D786AF0|nr:predicted GPI-anchored protein 58 [Phragmites australis]